MCLCECSGPITILKYCEYHLAPYCNRDLDLWTNYLILLSDICHSYTSYKPVEKGEVLWPETYLGTTVLTRCPYWTPDHTEITYAVSDCTLIMDPWDENMTYIWWTDPDMSQCSEAPFSVLMMEAVREIALEKVVRIIVKLALPRLFTSVYMICGHW